MPSVSGQCTQPQLGGSEYSSHAAIATSRNEFRDAGFVQVRCLAIVDLVEPLDERIGGLIPSLLPVIEIEDGNSSQVVALLLLHVQEDEGMRDIAFRCLACKIEQLPRALVRGLIFIRRRSDWHWVDRMVDWSSGRTLKAPMSSVMYLCSRVKALSPALHPTRLLRRVGRWREFVTCHWSLMYPR